MGRGRAQSRVGIRSHRRARGFTLLEVMVTMLIVALLSALAMPSYVYYVTRGRIPEATANLAVKQVQLEQFYQDNRTYSGAPACESDITTSAYFSFTCTTQTASTYTLTATGLGPMAGFSYTLTQSNARSTAAVRSGWTLPSPNTCWVTRKGGLC